ncbi:hypothetical protein M0L63_RS01950 [Providencia rettgeri]|uniref:hypothetical protein n=1 Tax=Providencia TaxID=586 RepID=UPI001F04163A|nr:MULTISPECIES: hypothetical protein [Providencia]EJD6581458.1 hypothetical protein [Providencia rettgeri]ELR5171743.1 hypothetical protein [Providencia rettgeri]ELR5196482.1 hypothetical protein [Providencia rettgeri]MCG9949605.1 hypothetical protein [Providencia rettgeri]
MSDKKEIATLSIKISVDSTDLDKLEAQLKRIKGLMVSTGLKQPARGGFIMDFNAGQISINTPTITSGTIKSAKIKGIVTDDAAGMLDKINEAFYNSGNKAFIAALGEAIDINIPVSHGEFTEFKQQVESEFSQLQASITAIQQTIADSDRAFAASLEHLRADIQSIKSGWL